ncbi:hypothetical protein PACTADRAFT_49301 [Pachysolen tannophilus NRRL Y-2460]|uniref:Major facilitator superfamily (MFS) profile domain-containing protein n=1 Tax=Pachysolen tannophilus NRRL Y-2460 TaxID=669874 RepID=A0A1E4TW20_PACTA|nr:hypothetical protein PACTADRAFT_49301 [Pachysolen tannophilus NRRL Y-2460]
MSTAASSDNEKVRVSGNGHSSINNENLNLNFTTGSEDLDVKENFRIEFLPEEEEEEDTIESTKMDTASIVHRRLSASVKPSFEAGSFGNLSAIPPPIPESLPTTPGFEIPAEEIMYSNRKNPLEFPDQQQLFRFKSSAVTSTITSNHTPHEMTLTFPPKNKWRVFAVCLWSFSGGASDGAPGAILSYIEDYYNISYSIVSLIWLSNAAGFIVVALCSDFLDAKLGKRKMACGGCFLTSIMFAIVSSGTIYPIICIGFFIGGLGSAMCLSQMNIFLSRFDKASTYLGWFHGSYGAGATASPIISTIMVNAGIQWHFYYLILLGLAISNLINLWFSFQGADEDLRPWDHREAVHGEDIITSSAIEEEEQEQENIELRTRPVRSETKIIDTVEPVIPKGDFKLAVKNLRTWLLTLFVFNYQAAEVSMGGWIVSFLENYRDGNKSSIGYVASGFWAGLTIGRLFLVHRIHKYAGAKRGVTIAAIGAIIFVLLAWLVNIIILEAVFISIAGIFVGPIYPLMITVATRVLPRKIQVISLTIMTSGGSSGGAVWPFMVGLISEFVGTFVVMPVFIGLFSVVLIVWTILPNPDRSVTKNVLERIF